MDNNSNKPQLNPSIPTTPPNFSSLPLELRQKIYCHLAHIPRNVDIWVKPILAPSSPNPNANFNPPPIWRYHTTQPVPSILHINAEARSIGLGYYAPSFGKRFTRGDFWSYDSPARVWINRYVDRICPMGPYTHEQKMDILAFCRLRSSSFGDNDDGNGSETTLSESRRSIALNTSEFLDHGALQLIIDGIWKHSHDQLFYQEILLYKPAYNQTKDKHALLKTPPRTSVDFQLIDIEEHNPSTRGLWMSVNAVRQYMLQSIEEKCTSHQKQIGYEARVMGREEVKEEEWVKWEMPEVRVVEICYSVDGG